MAQRTAQKVKLRPRRRNEQNSNNRPDRRKNIKSKSTKKIEERFNPNDEKH